MDGPISPVIPAIGISGAWPCFIAVAPFLTIAALRWVIRHTDHAVDRLFPRWEWEKRLGWLDLKTHRRAEAVVRWIGHLLHALLAAALYGIVWAAPALGRLAPWNDPGMFGKISLKLPVFLLCLGFCLAYLGFELLPKLRRQYESDELEKFRAEMAARELARDREPDSRFGPGAKSPAKGHNAASEKRAAARGKPGHLGN